MNEENLSVQVAGEAVEATISTEATGIAVAIVIDRGGIARQGDPRIGYAVDLAEGLLDRLVLDGTASSDVAGLIGIRGQDDGGLTPVVPFTDFDPNAVRNELNLMSAEVVGEVTPLYDGIDRAIDWFVEPAEEDMAGRLARRRSVIVVFSDGLDNRFSSESHEMTIINRCLENDIQLYAIRMGDGATSVSNLEALAYQTNGAYVTHSLETSAEVEALFDDVVTQRRAYRLAFPLRRRQGDYEVRIQVSGTPIGEGSDTATVSSQLRLPEIALSSPPEGAAYTVPFSRTAGGYLPVDVPLEVEFVSVDGVSRAPEEVVYFANGEQIGTSAGGPTFDVAWSVEQIVAPTEKAEAREYDLVAVATDPYLRERVESAPVTVRVTWQAAERSTRERVSKRLLGYGWLLIGLAVLGLGSLGFLIMLMRTRSDLVRRVASQARGAVAGLTRRLGVGVGQVEGKLVVIEGPGGGREFQLSAPVTKIGRDPAFCDFALHDDYTSNPHFLIRMGGAHLYVTDEGSANGTRIDGTPIRPHQRVLLQPGATIEVGQTRLRFERLGDETRRLA